MKKLIAEKCREQFEEWFADHAGQTVAWVKSQRASDTHYKIGPEIQRYWLTWQASREAFEIALPILEQQERGDGWIEWNGTLPDMSAYLHVKYRSGFIDSQRPASWVDWGDHDIIAYQIIPDHQDQ